MIAENLINLFKLKLHFQQLLARLIGRLANLKYFIPSPSDAPNLGLLFGPVLFAAGRGVVLVLNVLEDLDEGGLDLGVLVEEGVPVVGVLDEVDELDQ